MHHLGDLARKWLKEAEKHVISGDKPIDPLYGTEADIKAVSVDSGQKYEHISPRRSPIVNIAHVECLFIALELEFGRKFTKQLEGQGRLKTMQHWLKRMRDANLDEMSINQAMARLSGDWPPSLDQWIALCRPHTYEARVGHLQKYKGARPEPGPGYEEFKRFKEARRGPSKS